MRRRLMIAFALASLLAAIVAWTPAAGGAAMPFTIISAGFEAGSEIPKKYTCEGEDISPPLAWWGAPGGTKSFALVVDDPDAPDPAAPKMTWVHWVLYDIPGFATSIPEAARRTNLPTGTREGSNDWGRPTWGGPCPPIGRHRYFFKLYALDTTFDDLGTITKTELERLMKGHILSESQLLGTYQKHGK